jgi:hypothetical protein
VGAKKINSLVDFLNILKRTKTFEKGILGIHMGSKATTTNF